MCGGCERGVGEVARVGVIRGDRSVRVVRVSGF